MTADETSLLTETQQSDFCALLTLGCDRETACKYVGCSLDELRTAVDRESNFGKRILKAEAAVELKHMRNISKITEDPKEWKASIWWLEQHAPERFARRVDALPASKLRDLVTEVACAIGEEVTQEDDRRRMVKRLHQIADSLDEMFAPNRTAHEMDAEGVESEA